MVLATAAPGALSRSTMQQQQQQQLLGRGSLCRSALLPRRARSAARRNSRAAIVCKAGKVDSRRVVLDGSSLVIKTLVNSARVSGNPCPS